ncbi:ectonucleoside triphosphate diphosphohydrolase 3 isoform X2 [Callorhinchus milii]|uniref:ectonucleoside triphosphate diphosphohydrolase 3 isoform X2 n=1 Tax=Callorhinchus milii TaxID=7868 RepID=UPI000457336A|nr:ectonucleoside triphosphate diphosphohydrolase 3 isoform X2 [Callorhinchus milii]|eukprot:gi/632960667/ref/XP_007896325.1/ PREDICTED: ectonucleoside triphosphate diphosphohydrolase 3-like isoform X2 [Callorhinchus milii]
MKGRVRPTEVSIRAQHRSRWNLQKHGIDSEVVKRIIIAAVILFLCVTSIITITVVYITKSQILTAGMKYGIILEAGTVRTKLTVYQWPAEKIRNTGVVSEKLICYSQETGSPQYKQNPKKAIDSLANCLNASIKIIPKEEQSQTEIFFPATTEMRLLYLQDKVVAERIFSAIRVLFQRLPFGYGHITFVSPREEAIYGWIAANYLRGNLVVLDGLQQYKRSPLSRTTGALALVGGAAHITFIAKKVSKYIPTYKVTLFGYKYKVFTETFDCFGWKEAELRLLVHIYQAFGGFHYMRKALQLPLSFPVTKYNQAVWSFCTKKWAELKIMFPNISNTFIRYYCFGGHYIYTLLVHGYKFNPMNWKQITFTNKCSPCFR